MGNCTEQTKRVGARKEKKFQETEWREMVNGEDERKVGERREAGERKEEVNRKWWWRRGERRRGKREEER